MKMEILNKNTSKYGFLNGLILFCWAGKSDSNGLNYNA